MATLAGDTHVKKEIKNFRVRCSNFLRLGGKRRLAQSARCRLATQSVFLTVHTSRFTFYDLTVYATEIKQKVLRNATRAM